MRKKIIIDGKETNYSITDDAHLYNDRTGREIKGTYSTNEYHSVQLVIDGKPKTFMFHRLVAQAFCENPNGYTIVDHIDRNKRNDCASNLRWVDSSINAKNCERKSTKTKNIKYLGDFSEKLWYSVWKHSKYMISEDCEVVNLQNRNIMCHHQRHGYSRVNLGDRLYSLHKIFWESVNLQDIPEGFDIDHIDGNKQNNHISNLCLAKHSDNMKNAYNNGHKGQVAVKQYTLQGEYIKTYPTIREAALDIGILEAGLKDATNRHGSSGGFYWIRENDPITIEEVMTNWVPEGFTIIPEYPTYCINNKGEVYNKRNKKLVPVHYRADGITPYITIKSKRINISNLMP